jgi:endonuclease/exonuclease/phosphatase (EEP) superfamily protein YafD
MKGLHLQKTLLISAVMPLFLWGISNLAGTKLGRPLRVGGDGQPSLRVMTWNAHFLNKNSAAFFATIAAEQPDLVAIQELSIPLAEAISAELQERYPFQSLYPTKTPAGMGILSRYPFVTTTPPDFSANSGCNCQLVTIDVAGQTITLISAHPWPPKTGLTGGSAFEFNTETQDRLFDQLLARIDQAASPLLVVGDLNTMPIQRNYWRLRQRLQDAYIASGAGLAATFPVKRNEQSWLGHPLLRIDYIFYDQTWQSQRTWGGAIAGSDHRYVMADLVLGQ